MTIEPKPDAEPQDDQDLVLIGHFQKPYGLVGEMKVKPETFDFNRYKQLQNVTAKLQGTGELKSLSVQASRADDRYWYFRFRGYRTPEAAAVLSGAELFVPNAEKLALPEGMVYFTDIPGCMLFDENGEEVGIIANVLDQGVQQFFRLNRPTGEVLIPWNDHFIKRIDIQARRIEADLGPLRGVIL